MEDQYSDDPHSIVMMTTRDFKRSAAMLALIVTGKIDDSDIKRVWRSKNREGDVTLLKEMMQDQMAGIMKEVNLKRAEEN